jgi:hypothetical protein
VLALAASLPSGFVISWAAVLDISLKHLHTRQSTNGLVGFSQQGVAALAGLAVASMADRLQRKHKACIVAMYGLSTLGFLWFALATSGWGDSCTGSGSGSAETGGGGGGGGCSGGLLFHLSIETAFASTILGVAMQSAALPIFMELACATPGTPAPLPRRPHSLLPSLCRASLLSNMIWGGVNL